MIRIFDVFISVIGPGVTGNEPVPVVEADPVRIGFEREE